VTTAADRRRRPFALAFVALGLAVVFALALRAPAARAARSACPLADPLCDSSTTLDTAETSTTLFDATPTTDPSDAGRGSPDTTERRRTTSTTEPTTTTARSVTVVTTHDLLVPGDGTKGAETTTTTIAKVAVGNGGMSDDQLIVLVVAGLAVMSLAMGLLTWRYWEATRPVAEERRATHAGRP
jgi:hypothetical protein